MDKETWSIAISVAGLLLGLLSAHAQLRSMARWALKATGDRARAWVNRINDRADLYASNSSALIAFLVKESLSVVTFLFFSIALLGLLKGDTFTTPLWVRQTLMLAIALWVGNRLAGISHLIDMTLRRAKEMHSKPSGRSLL